MQCTVRPLLAASAGCTLALEAPEQVRVVWDRLRIEQALLNLVTNACKNTPAPGSVTIPVDYSDELVEALRQPYTVAVDESALSVLGVQLGDRAIYAGTLWD